MEDTYSSSLLKDLSRDGDTDNWGSWFYWVQGSREAFEKG
jgi:hypothetical protein